MQECELIFTARFARDAEDTENNNFSITVERTVMEKHLAAYAAERTKSMNSLVTRCNCGHFITRRVESFCFSASQRKAKKTKALRAPRLCGESVIIKTL